MYRKQAHLLVCTIGRKVMCKLNSIARYITLTRTDTAVSEGTVHASRP